MEGTIKDPEKLTFTIEDILPLDKGDKTYTSYDIDERHIEYLMEDESRMDWKMGHIHSHNDMNVFFSGTDMSELNDNAPSHNFYLSLITNNYLDFEAKVGFVAKVDVQVPSLEYEALDENGEKYTIQKMNFTVKKEKLFVYDCDIVTDIEPIMIEDGFVKRVDDIMKPKVVAQPYIPPTVHRIYAKDASQTTRQNAKVKNSSGRNLLKQARKKVTNFFDRYNDDDLFDLDPEPNAEDAVHMGFCIAVMSFSSVVEEGVTLEDVLNDLESYEISPIEIASSVLNVYPSIYEIYYGEDSPSMYVDRANIFIENLEEHAAMYPIVEIVIDSITNMITKFENNATTV